MPQRSGVVGGDGGGDDDDDDDSEGTVAVSPAEVHTGTAWLTEHLGAGMSVRLLENCFASKLFALN